MCRRQFQCSCCRCKHIPRQLAGTASDCAAHAVQGYHQGRFAGRIPDAAIGTAKAVLGIVIRPTAGMLEWVSKGTHGLGLVCLGREAISGSAQRRMRAPGSLVDDSPDALDDVRAPEVVAQRRQLMGAWQRSLSNLFPQMQVPALCPLMDPWCSADGTCVDSRIYAHVQALHAVHGQMSICRNVWRFGNGSTFSPRSARLHPLHSWPPPLILICQQASSLHIATMLQTPLRVACLT